MSPLSGTRFLKMNGLGNEIVVVDLRGAAHQVTSEEARRIATGPGSGFDQLMAIHDPVSQDTDAFVRIYNRDGSPAGACGNGTRCVAWAMRVDPLVSRGERGDLVLETEAGLLRTTRVADATFTVDMGAPRLRWDEIPLAEPFVDTSRIELQVGPIEAPILHSPGCVSVGNPHAVFFVDDPARFDLARLGPLLENHPIFPDRANISLAAVPARDRIVLRVWERGAGLTRACGSAACAALVAAVRRRLTGRQAAVALPGGVLDIAWREADDHVLMTGPVEFEHAGTFDPSLFSAAA